MRCFALIILGSFLSVSAFAADPIGAQACGTCHLQEYEQWKKTPHATALARLSSIQQRNRGCRGCHTTAARSEDPRLGGVQCESCHGLGQFYAPANVMKDKELAKIMGLKQINEATCMTCHKADGPGLENFDYKAKLPMVSHRPPIKPKNRMNK